MTTKQIAEAVNKTERSVRNWIEKITTEKFSVPKESSSVVNSIKLKAGSKNSIHPADYNLDETLLIIEVGLGKNAAAIYRSSAEAPQSDIAAIVRETITAMVPVLVEIVRGALPQQAAALPAPVDLSQRDQLRRVINGYAHRSGDHSGAWRELYTQFYYRYHRNIRECAKNRNMDTLDYVENEGLMEDLLALAISLYGGVA